MNWDKTYSMIKKSHMILYVEDQQKSTAFYTKLLNQTPTLSVPGMTEFNLSESTILGLMPSAGIKNLLGNAIDEPQPSDKIPRAELYLVVENIKEYINHAEDLKAKILSPLEERDWGHQVIYFEDLDGYVIAFAQ